MPSRSSQKPNRRATKNHELLVEAFLIGVGVVIEAVWVNLGVYVDRCLAYIATPRHCLGPLTS